MVRSNCAYCGKPIPEGGSPTRLYCSKECGSRSRAKRRWQVIKKRNDDILKIPLKERDKDAISFTKYILESYDGNEVLYKENLKRFKDRNKNNVR